MYPTSTQRRNTMNNQTTILSNRELRKNREEQARSEAINRHMLQLQQEAYEAKVDMRFFVSIASFFCLIAFSALAGLNA